ncbi:DNA cytosine methyltransferase [Qipengyuania marisflavi]|uniref:DNA cytosine methyltransferase n=1 Tax=Qipengyuania marisflavi TaxID=2486356 RepID=UPI001CA3A925|nr:DNA cytosine methyltransferase [Qipengyuania marisflavi]
MVSLFSGAGGLDLGLLQAGLEIVWANDIFKEAAETYGANIDAHVDTRDIIDIDEQEIPDCDVLVGGFPCQGFSVANWGRNSEDPRNQLYREMIRILRAKRPKFFLGENVKGLLSMANGEALRSIIRDIEESGYKVQYALVNCADYGVPQARMRVLIFGIREDVVWQGQFPPKVTHAEPIVASREGLKPWLTVGEALSHYPEPEDGTDIPNHECSQYKLRFNGHLGHRRIDPHRPSPTVTSRGDNKGGVVVLHHPNNHRRMTARELAAVQSFPDDFVFSGSKTNAYRQISNAVPPLLGMAIGKMLLDGVPAVQEKIDDRGVRPDLVLIL